jgi:hypothetical protein
VFKNQAISARICGGYQIQNKKALKQ